MKLGVAADLARQVMARVFAPKENLAPDAWGEKYRTISEGARKGPMDLSKTPNLRGPLRAFADPKCRMLTIVAAAQCGKTTGIMFTAMMWSWDHAPGAWMVMLPKDSKAVTFNRTRFVPEVEGTPRASGHLLKVTDALLTTTAGTVEWIGSNAPANSEGTPAKYVWVDEFDRCFLTGIRKLRQRGKTFSDKKEIETGTPGWAGVGIDARYHAAGRRYRWHVPCPTCRHYATREWENVKWTGGKAADPGDVRRTAWMECPKCKGRIGPEHLAWQASLGVWVCQTQTVGPVRTIEQSVGFKDDVPGEVLGEAPDTEHWGFWISGLDNGLVDNAPGEVAADWINDVREFGQGSREWVCESLGRAYSAKARKLDIAVLEAKARSSTFSMGLAPPWAIGMIAAADVQADRIEWVQVAYGPRGRQLALVGWGQTPWFETGDLYRALDNVKAKKVLLAVKAGEPRRWLPTMFLAVDTGFKATELYAYRAKRDPGIKLVKGDAVRHDKRAWLFQKSEQGAEGMTRVPLLKINLTPWKDRLAGLLGGPTPAPRERPGVGGGGGGAVGPGGSGGGDGGIEELSTTLELPRDLPAEVLEQLVAEHFVGGLWVKKVERLPNEAWDCMVYATASLVAYGVEQLTVSLAVSEGTNHGQARERSEPRDREPRHFNPLG